MPQVFSNNSRTTLAGSISNSATTINVAADTGDKFPFPTGGDFFLVTLWEMSGDIEINHEIVKCTARTADALTVVRAQEGTKGRAFANATPIELRWTAAAAGIAVVALPLIGGAMVGPIDMTNNDLSRVKAISFNDPVDDGASGGAYTVYFTSGLYHKLAMSANCVLTFIPPAGPAVCHLEVTQGAGAYTWTLPAGKWEALYAAADKQLSAGVGALDLLFARWNGTFWIYQLAKGCA